MRDIIRDAAILTIATAAKGRGLTPQDIFDMYPKEAEEMIDLLSELFLIEQGYWVRDVWDDKYEKERFVYYWKWSEKA